MGDVGEPARTVEVIPDVAWQPTEVGQPFLLVLSDNRQLLMRITEITDSAHWQSTLATAGEFTTEELADLPHVHHDLRTKGNNVSPDE